MPPETTTAVLLELLYVAPPAAQTPANYRAYIERQLEINHGVLTNPALFATGGFHVRNTGRTTLIGLALLEQARRQPGQLVPYRDHSHQGADWRARTIMGETVRAIIEACPDYQAAGFTLSEHGITAPAQPVLPHEVPDFEAFRTMGFESLGDFHRRYPRLPGYPVQCPQGCGILVSIQNLPEGQHLAHIDLGGGQGWSCNMSFVRHATWGREQRWQKGWYWPDIDQLGYEAKELLGPPGSSLRASYDRILAEPRAPAAPLEELVP